MRMKPTKKAYRSRAIAGLWVTGMLLLIIPMLGWAMDRSYVAYVVQQLQVAADGASLAGAGAAKTDLALARLRAQATGAANTAGITASVPDPVLLELNEANLPDGDIVTGRYYRWDRPIEEHICKDGDNHNGICSTDADCPGGGSCLTTVWARPGYYPGGIRVTGQPIDRLGSGHARHRRVHDPLRWGNPRAGIQGLAGRVDRMERMVKYNRIGPSTVRGGKEG